MSVTNTFSAASVSSLNSDISALDTLTAGGTYTLDITGNIALGTTPLAALSLAAGVTLDIVGGGFTLDGGGAERGLSVDAGTVAISDLTIANMTAVGAAGVSGGGGGAGLGGGLFIGANVAGDAGMVTLDNVSFNGDAATGGAGSAGLAAGGGASQAGFGAGGAAGSAAGFGGGNATGGNGGGGLGAGGDIFVQAGASLVIAGDPATSIANGTVTGGAGAGAAQPGQAFGSGIYLQGAGAALTLDNIGNNLTIDAPITDDAGAAAAAGYTGPASYAPGGTSVVVTGAGSVVFLVVNGYTGGTTIESGTLELGQGATAGNGAITFAAPGSTLVLDADGGSGYTFTDPLAGFLTNGTIELANLPYVTGASAVVSGTTLTLNNGGTIETFTLAAPAPAGQTYYVYSDGSTGIDLTSIACFAEGTRILTERGEVAVESLRVGDVLVCAAGGTAPVKWLGHRRIEFSRHPRGPDAMPVRIMPGAFGPGRPKRELRLSPDHAVFTNGRLVPVRLLINGGSIAVERCEAVTYWHVELPAHGVIFAESLETESYLDTGNRGAFVECDTPDLHASFERTAGAAWENEGFAPLLLSGPILDGLRARLAERSAAIGAPCADVAVLRIDGAGVFEVEIPEGAGFVRLASQSATPAGERRRLGAAIAGATLDGETLALDDGRFERGFFPAEASWRWTDGEGVLAVGACDRPRTLRVDVAAVAARVAA